MDLVDCLIETGLTRHEAQLYLLLCSEGVMSGYEASKQTGISRSNTYIALAGLAGKGAAMCIEGDVRRYAAVPAAEYCQSKRRRFENVLQVIQEQIPRQREITEPFLTIKGEEAILDEMRNLISQAKQRIYLALSPAERDAVLPELARLCGLGRKVVLITPPPFELAGATVYHAAKQPGQIRLIVDSATVLTGEIRPQGESSCLFSKNQALVSLLKESMVNEIQLISVSAEQTANQPADRRTEERIGT